MVTSVPESVLQERLDAERRGTMIRSMTGFGRYEYARGGKKYAVEMKSVNHRYLDLNIKMPKNFNFFEAEIRNLLKKYIQRGKVDLYITYEDASAQGCSIRYNSLVAGQYVSAMREMAREFSLNDDLTVSKLARFPEIFTVEELEPDEKEMSDCIWMTVEEAAKRLVEARQLEGERLKEDLLEKFALLEREVSYVEKRSPEIVELYQKRLEEKVSALLDEVGVDQSRILTEVTIFADKTCVDEEVVRLHSHINSVRNVLEEGGSIGRKLDFIIQEMNREANTILSKANHLDISHHGIVIKTEIEKIREQIQNIE